MVGRWSTRTVKRVLTRELLIRIRVASTPYLLLLPAAVVYVAFRFGPSITNVWMSFFKWNGINPTTQFVAFRYYKYVITDPYFLNAIVHNFILLALAVVVPVTVGFVLALLLSHTTKFRTVFRVLLFLPAIFSGVVVAYIWSWIYTPINGLLNGVLQWLGLRTFTTAWLGNPHTALLSVFGAYAWSSYGYSMVFFIAGLQGIDPSLFDAGEIDGISGWQRIWYIIVPCLRNVITYVVTLRILTALKQFQIPFILTGGGPNFATDVMELYTYRYISNYQFGIAGAAAVLETALVFLVAFTFIRGRER